MEEFEKNTLGRKKFMLQEKVEIKCYVLSKMSIDISFLLKKIIKFVL